MFGSFEDKIPASIGHVDFDKYMRTGFSPENHENLEDEFKKMGKVKHHLALVVKAATFNDTFTDHSAVGVNNDGEILPGSKYNFELWKFMNFLCRDLCYVSRAPPEHDKNTNTDAEVIYDEGSSAAAIQPNMNGCNSHNFYCYGNCEADGHGNKTIIDLLNEFRGEGAMVLQHETCPLHFHTEGKCYCLDPNQNYERNFFKPASTSIFSDSEDDDDDDDEEYMVHTYNKMSPTQQKNFFESKNTTTESGTTITQFSVASSPRDTCAVVPGSNDPLFVLFYYPEDAQKGGSPTKAAAYAIHIFIPYSYGGKSIDRIQSYMMQCMQKFLSKKKMKKNDCYSWWEQTDKWALPVRQLCNRHNLMNYCNRVIYEDNVLQQQHIGEQQYVGHKDSEYNVTKLFNFFQSHATVLHNNTAQLLYPKVDERFFDPANFYNETGDQFKHAMPRQFVLSCGVKINDALMNRNNGIMDSTRIDVFFRENLPMMKEYANKLGINRVPKRVSIGSLNPNTATKLRSMNITIHNSQPVMDSTSGLTMTATGNPLRALVKKKWEGLDGKFRGLDVYPKN